jgi:hypothetical protein
MKINGRDYIVTPQAGTAEAAPHVLLEVLAWGMRMAGEVITPDQARLFALQLQNAANVAEANA